MSLTRNTLFISHQKFCQWVLTVPQRPTTHNMKDISYQKKIPSHDLLTLEQMRECPLTLMSLRKAETRNKPS